MPFCTIINDLEDSEITKNDISYTVTPEKIIINDIKIYKIGKICNLQIQWTIGEDHTLEAGDTIRINLNSDISFPVYNSNACGYMNSAFYIGFFYSSQKMIDIRFNQKINSPYTMTIIFSYICKE